MPVYENNYGKQLKQMIRDNTRFVSLMGHEIRTYMNAIVGFANILESEDISAEQKEFASSILENGNGLLCLTDKIVEYSRIRAMDQAGIIRSKVSTSQILEKVEAKWSEPIRNKGLHFNIVRSPSTPEQFHSCQDHILRCIDILMDNALRYTQNGHITFSVTSKREEDDGTFLMIDVEDSGCGIACHLHHSVFEPFERGDHEEMTSGMELAILAALMELHNGAVFFDSVEGEGSDFSICLPIEIGKSPASEKHGKDESAFGQNIIAHHSNASSCVSCKVLIADDNYSSRKLMKVLLEGSGCKCEFARNGQAVLDMINDEYDIVLMDIRMPDMSGLEVTAKLRENGFTKPIIAVTAFAMPYDQDECISAGCNGYISKPLSRDVLINTIKKYL